MAYPRERSRYCRCCRQISSLDQCHYQQTAVLSASLLRNGSSLDLLGHHARPIQVSTYNIFLVTTQLRLSPPNNAVAMVVLRFCLLLTYTCQGEYALHTLVLIAVSSDTSRRLSLTHTHSLTGLYLLPSRRVGPFQRQAWMGPPTFGKRWICTPAAKRSTTRLGCPLGFLRSTLRDAKLRLFPNDPRRAAQFHGW